LDNWKVKTNIFKRNQSTICQNQSTEHTGIRQMSEISGYTDLLKKILQKDSIIISEKVYNIVCK